jgi:DNA polymerase, archaea type
MTENTGHTGDNEKELSLLYGRNRGECLIAVRQAGNGMMRLFLRKEGTVSFHDVEFFPFFYLTETSYIQELGFRHWVKELGGTQKFRFLCAFPGWSEFWLAVRYVFELYNSTHTPRLTSYLELPVLSLRPDPVHQFLLQSGKTLFGGIDFADLRRMQLHCTTSHMPGAKGSGTSPEYSKITSIGLCDSNGWETTLTTKRSDEAGMLEKFVELLIERDPDIIETSAQVPGGLSLIIARCAKLNVGCAIGRDGSEPALPEGRTVPLFDRGPGDTGGYDIAGRHWLDLQHHRTRSRTNEIILPSGNPVPPDSDGSSADPLTAARSIRSVTDRVGPLFFEFAKILPYSYSISARISPTAALEAIMMREYLRIRHSIPEPPGTGSPEPHPPVSFFTGLHEPALRVECVEHASTTALRLGISSGRDEATVLSRLVDELRLLSPAHPRDSAVHLPETPNRAEAAGRLLDALLPYLASGRSYFGDQDLAGRIIVEMDRELTGLAATAERRGATVIHRDENGFLLVPPRQITGAESRERFVTSLGISGESAPETRLHGSYDGLLVLRNDQYALRAPDDRVLIHGQPLVAKSLEIFLRRFLHESIRAVLRKDITGLHSIYNTFHHDITGHRINSAEFARQETLREDYEEYRAGVAAGSRSPSGAYEAAIRAGLSWKPGERVWTYMTGTEALARETEHLLLATEWDPNRPDENTAWYIRRLDEVASRFEVLFAPEEFHAIFAVDDLFGFSAEGFSILTKPIQRRDEQREEEPADDLTPQPTIWLDDEAGN